ncbi:MAG: SusC/RagA family TonB-linked outer membrane protein [Ginsengibacter sp.]
MRILKITILLLCLIVTFLCTDIGRAYAQNNYSYNTDNAKNISTKKSGFYLQEDAKNEKSKLINVLKELNKVKGVYFMFSNQSLGNKVVNIVDDMSEEVELILDKILKNTGLAYKKINNNTFVILSIKDVEKSTSGIQSIGYSNMIAVESQSNFTAPDEVITGKVVDKDGNSVPGVSVAIKGKGKGTSTNSSGVFSIEAEKGDVLIFTSVGYELQQFVVGNDNTIQIALVENNKQLNEVVVTALGIERKSKSLTYATQKVSNADLTTVKDASFVNSLTGKVAGVTITKSSSGIGGSTRVIIRGNKSTRENQPLYVVDGVPLSNFSPGQPGDVYGQTLGYVGIDGGDGIANINPDDIESLNVLKGASAAALYGSAAANGVILITTKKGKAGSVKIDVSSEVTFDSRLYKTPLQFKYGQTIPVTDSTTGSADSWGNAINAPNHVDPFFRTGVTTFNSLSLTGGNEKSQSYFSYSYLDNKGIIPTSKLYKHNFTFRNNYKLSEKFSTDFSVLYINQESSNRPVSGLYDNPLTGLYQFPRGLDFNNYKNNYEVYSPVRNFPIQNWWDLNSDKGYTGSEVEQNPYWLLNRNVSKNKLDRIYSNLSVVFKINGWLSLQARGNIDKSLNNIDVKSYATTHPILTAFKGSYSLLKAVNTQLYGDLLLTGNKDLSENLRLSATIGSSITDTKLDQTSFGTKTSGGDGLQIANVFVLSNIVPNNLSISQGGDHNGLSHKQVQALFGTAQLNWKENLYLDLTARNDWSSTFAFTPTKNKGYFYYSAGVTAVLSDILKMAEPVSFSKVRISYARVGNDVAAYASNIPDFYPNFDANQGINKNNIGPYPGTYLKPEDNRSFEVGTEWGFLKSRLGFDFTFYQNNNYKQYLTVPAPQGSGVNTWYINGGNIQNTGVELSVFATPVSTPKIKWTSTINFASNKNKVVSLSNDQLNVVKKFYNLTGIGNFMYASDIVVGGSWGDIYGYFFKRNASGYIIVDSAGVPSRGEDTSANPVVGDSKQKFLGNPNPKYTIGWSNTITISKFTISFLIDGRFGGKVLSETQGILDRLGDSKATADARDAGGVSFDAVTADGSKYTGKTDARLFYSAVGGAGGISEYYIYDATNVRLRELALGYTLPIKTKGISSVKLSLIGRNLFFFSKKAPFDPDISMATNNGLQGIETFGIPSTRSMGVSLKVGF